MREILFRGKRIDNGEWVYGYYSKHSTGKTFIRVNGKPCTGSYEVDPKSVSEFTGSIDKRGNKIFEGDIVKNYFSKRFSPSVGRVAFDERDCRVKLYSCTDCNENGFYRGCIYEVIGNIHDNQELLEGEQND